MLLILHRALSELNSRTFFTVLATFGHMVSLEYRLVGPGGLMVTILSSESEVRGFKTRPESMDFFRA